MKLIRKLLIPVIVVGIAACASNPAPAVNGVSSAKGDVNTDKNVLTNSIYFSINSAEVTRSYHRLLTINASYLISHPYASVQIQGNSSEIGTPEHNKELGMIRAQNVKQELIALGVPAKQISIVSFGNSKLVFPSETGGRQPKNQRADIVYINLAPYQYTQNPLPKINITTMY